MLGPQTCSPGRAALAAGARGTNGIVDATARVELSSRQRTSQVVLVCELAFLRARSSQAVGGIQQTIKGN